MNFNKSELKNCLLISLGAYGKNNLITNGKDFKNILATYYENLEIISSDKYIKKPRLFRLFNYIKDIVLHLVDLKKKDVFIHMNTQFALPIIICPLNRKNKIITWYSHKKIPIDAKLVISKSDVVVTGSPEIMNLYPNKSLFTHSIRLPKNEDICRCNLKNNSKRNLVFLGRFSAVKRLDLFVDVAIEAANQGLIDGVRIMANSHERDTEEMVRNNLMDCKVPVEIIANSDLNNIYSFFKAGDIYLNAQNEAGIGKAMLEACAVGIEVIVANNQLKEKVKTISERTINGKVEIKKVIKILKYILELDTDESNIQSKQRINSASKLTVDNLIFNTISRAYP